MASKRCKNTGESQINFKMAKALARLSTLSKMCGLLLEAKANLDVVAEVLPLLELPAEVPDPEVAEEAEAAAEASPSRESTSDSAASFCWEAAWAWAAAAAWAAATDAASRASAA